MGDRDGEPDLPAGREAELSKRLSDLDRRLDEHRTARDMRAPVEPQPKKPGVALAMRLGADFVAGTVLGAALGWGFDRLFGTSPWGLTVFLLLGFAAGILTVLRTAGLMKPGPAGPDDKFG
jgi:ATP synthase protein I